MFKNDYHFEDFTETHYRSLLRLAKKRYVFEWFGTQQTAPHVLWRHDMDYSVHRALRLAQVEVEEGVRSTFFILPHSEFYNVLEKGIYRRIHEIGKLGHQLALHFDMGFYSDISDTEALEQKLGWEKIFIEDLLESEVKVFSFHNPDVGGTLSFSADTMVGMINTYSATLQKNYFYCSDSNGYWRYNRLFDVLNEGKESQLHILTHPEWWTPEVMSPRERIGRCIEGRTEYLNHSYDALIQQFGRQNVGKQAGKI